MNTTLDAVIKHLTKLREELGGDVRVLIRETKSVLPRHRHTLESIDIGERKTYRGTEVIRTKEVIFHPYLAP